jgi:hypothetical protein
MTGIPCPLCGMSTSVEATVRGRWSEALAANPMGIVVVVAALAVLFGMRVNLARIPKWAVGAVLGAMWLFELARFSL